MAEKPTDAEAKPFTFGSKSYREGSSPTAGEKPGDSTEGTITAGMALFKEGAPGGEDEGAAGLVVSDPGTPGYKAKDEK